MTPPRTTLRLAAGAAVAVLALTGCADGDTDEASAPTVSSTPSGTVSTPEATDPSGTASASPSASASEAPSASPSATTPAEPERVSLRAGVKGGQVITESDVYPVSPGQPVRIAVRTDAPNELHVHGAEQTLPLEANRKGVLEFELPADLAPGRYEVELHEGPILLFTLEVS